MNFMFQQGQKGPLQYTIIPKDPKKRFDFRVKDDKLLKLALTDFTSFVANHVPNFENFEIEEFIAEQLLISIAKKDINNILNLEIYYNQYFPYKVRVYTPNEISQKILDFCEVSQGKIFYLGKKNS